METQSQLSKYYRNNKCEEKEIRKIINRKYRSKCGHTTEQIKTALLKILPDAEFIDDRFLGVLLLYNNHPYQLELKCK